MMNNSKKNIFSEQTFLNPLGFSFFVWGGGGGGVVLGVRWWNRCHSTHRALYAAIPAFTKLTELMGCVELWEGVEDGGRCWCSCGAGAGAVGVSVGVSEVLVSCR